MLQCGAVCCWGCLEGLDVTCRVVLTSLLHVELC